jgi:hypothetical protein
MQAAVARIAVSDLEVLATTETIVVITTTVKRNMTGLAVAGKTFKPADPEIGVPGQGPTRSSQMFPRVVAPIC